MLTFFVIGAATGVFVAHQGEASFGPLSMGLRAHGHRDVIPLQDSGSLAGVVAGIAKSGDYVVCLGAGNITQWAYALPGQLEAFDKAQS